MLSIIANCLWAFSVVLLSWVIAAQNKAMSNLRAKWIKSELAKQDLELAKQDLELAKQDSELVKQDSELVKQDSELVKQDEDLIGIVRKLYWSDSVDDGFMALNKYIHERNRSNFRHEITPLMIEKKKWRWDHTEELNRVWIGSKQPVVNAVNCLLKDSTLLINNGKIIVNTEKDMRERCEELKEKLIWIDEENK